MHRQSYFIFLSVVGTVLSAVSSHHDDRKSKVYHEGVIQSPHEIDGVHNPKYDQEALFGEDAKKFGDLTPEEGIKQLRAIFDKMDVDHDGQVSPEELHTWLRKVHQRMSLADTERIWTEHELKPSQLLSWEHYWENAIAEDGEYEDDDEKTREFHRLRDLRRWDIADEDKDGKLSLQEAVAFFLPETDPRMQDILVKETIEELDKDDDGTIDVNEFIADIWKPTSGESEPEWVASERTDFVEHRDTDHDGKLNEAEVKAWRFPDDYDYMKTEVQHLFAQCDTDRDGRLTKSEMEDRYDVLIGSSATNYGEILSNHDEL